MCIEWTCTNNVLFKSFILLLALSVQSLLEKMEMITLLWPFVQSYHFYLLSLTNLWCFLLPLSLLSTLATPAPNIPLLQLFPSVINRLGQWGGAPEMWACLTLILTLCLLHGGGAESEGGGPRCQLPPAWKIGEVEPMRETAGQVTVVALLQASWLFCLVQASRYMPKYGSNLTSSPIPGVLNVCQSMTFTLLGLLRNVIQIY